MRPQNAVLWLLLQISTFTFSFSTNSSTVTNTHKLLDQDLNKTYIALNQIYADCKSQKKRQIERSGILRGDQSPKHQFPFRWLKQLKWSKSPHIRKDNVATSSNNTYTWAPDGWLTIPWKSNSSTGTNRMYYHYFHNILTIYGRLSALRSKSFIKWLKPRDTFLPFFTSLLPMSEHGRLGWHAEWIKRRAVSIDVSSHLVSLSVRNCMKKWKKMSCNICLWFLSTSIVLRAFI